MYTRSKHYLDFNLAGFTYWDGLDVIEDLKLGTELSLKSESDNPYDPDAVAIYYGKYKIGYVPRTHNSEISNFLYFGHENIFDAKISSASPEEHPERQFRVTIKIRDAR